MVSRRNNCQAKSRQVPLNSFIIATVRDMFGPKRDEVTVERRKLHNEELNDL
jgi:hypothetical protein